jgi:type IV pilus assembly protein PilY1
VQATDASSGATLWVFTPPDVDVSTSGDRITDLRVLRFDANGDGTIDIIAGDKVWLYFGTRQGGPFYYALDISNRDRPQLMWTASSDSLDGLSNAWSTPTIARVRVEGARQNGEHFVLVFGGGYSGSADDTSSGSRIFIVDAATGHLLWSEAVSDDMSKAFAARVAVVDTDGDAFADRMYAVDVAGHVWRFDISNGQPGSSLVAGGILADLSDEAGALFFNAPDVSLIQPRGEAPYYNIAVGSDGFFYSIRDRDPFARRSQASYDLYTPIRADALVDLSAGAADARIPPDAAGWKIALRSSVDGSAAGEVVAGESITADGVVLFTTFQSDDAGACTVGVTRVYAVRIDSGTAGLDLNDDGEVTVADLSAALPADSPPGELRIVNSSPRAAPHEGNDTTPGEPQTPNDTDARSTLTCTVGTHVLAKCVSPGTTVRTWWQRPAVK